MDTSVINNYRPISFLRNDIEKAVLIVNAFMANSNYFNLFQSGFFSNHSTETTFTEVMNDINACSDLSKVAILMLLDLSVFHTVYHNILLDSFEKWPVRSHVISLKTMNKARNVGVFIGLD